MEKVLPSLRRIISRILTARYKRAPVENVAINEVTALVNGWERKLTEAGVGDADFNLKRLVAHVLRQDYRTLPNYQDVNFTNEQIEEFQRLCAARCARMPLQYLVGKWDFMGITLKTVPTVSIPRPVTQEFVQKVIEKYQEIPPANMLDVGCGSGAMSLAILKALPVVKCAGIDCNHLATSLSMENAELLGLQDRFKAYIHKMEKDNYLPAELEGCKYDLIISNPPYVKTDEFQHLEPEVMDYEHFEALDGGPNGLRVARLIIDMACEYLNPNGALWLELGAEQPSLVKTIINSQYEGRLQFVASYEDQYKCERFVEIEKI